jgi:hypothetical protein
VSPCLAIDHALDAQGETEIGSLRKQAAAHAVGVLAQRIVQGQRQARPGPAVPITQALGKVIAQEGELMANAVYLHRSPPMRQRAACNA